MPRMKAKKGSDGKTVRVKTYTYTRTVKAFTRKKPKKRK